MATGVIGLGNIGGHIAVNLVADGKDVVVYDVDARAAEAVQGATAAPDVASVAASGRCHAVVPADARRRGRRRRRWASAAPPGSILVDLSTNSPTVVRELGERLLKSGHHLVEAPLTGGAIGAEKRMLVFMVGGEDEPVARVVPVLEPLGRATFHVGRLGLGNTMKLLNSLIAFTTTWVSLEGLAFASKAGIEVQKAVEILRTAGASNFFIDRQVETIDGRGRPTQFALGLAAKDAGLIVDWGRSSARQRRGGRGARACSTARSSGLGGADWSELVAHAEQQARRGAALGRAGERGWRTEEAPGSGGMGSPPGSVRAEHVGGHPKGDPAAGTPA